jgi:hypothetical protein
MAVSLCRTKRSALIAGQFNPRLIGLLTRHVRDHHAGKKLFSPTRKMIAAFRQHYEWLAK